MEFVYGDIANLETYKEEFETTDSQSNALAIVGKYKAVTKHNVIIIHNKWYVILAGCFRNVALDIY